MTRTYGTMKRKSMRSGGVVGYARIQVDDMERVDFVTRYARSRGLTETAALRHILKCVIDAALKKERELETQLQENNCGL